MCNGWMECQKWNVMCALQVECNNRKRIAGWSIISCTYTMQMQIQFTVTTKHICPTSLFMHLYIPLVLDVSCLIVHFTTYETIEFHIFVQIPGCFTRVLCWYIQNGLRWMNGAQIGTQLFVKFRKSICICNGVTTCSKKRVFFEKKLATWTCVFPYTPICSQK